MENVNQPLLRVPSPSFAPCTESPSAFCSCSFMSGQKKKSGVIGTAFSTTYRNVFIPLLAAVDSFAQCSWIMGQQDVPVSDDDAHFIISSIRQIQDRQIYLNMSLLDIQSKSSHFVEKYLSCWSRERQELWYTMREANKELKELFFDSANVREVIRHSQIPLLTRMPDFHFNESMLFKRRPSFENNGGNVYSRGVSMVDTTNDPNRPKPMTMRKRVSNLKGQAINKIKETPANELAAGGVAVATGIGQLVMFIMAHVR